MNKFLLYLSKKPWIGPILIIFYAISILLWAINGIEKFANFLDSIIGIYFPPFCIFLAILIIPTEITIFIRLVSGKRAIFKGEKRILNIPKHSTKRILYLSALTFIPIIGLLAGIFVWHRHYNLPLTNSNITIYIDDFVVPGLENINFPKRIESELKRELNDILPELEISILPPVPKGIDDLDKKLQLACDCGATLIIYATGDELGVWPNIKICPDSIPRLPYEDYETQIGYTSSWNLDSVNIRLCLVDSLNYRTKYLALFSLGLVFLYDDSLNMNDGQRLLIAQKLLARATDSLYYRQDCDLNFCQALFYRAISEASIAMASQFRHPFFNYFDSSFSSFEKATDIDPNFAKAWMYWGDVLRMMASRFKDFRTLNYLRESLQKYKTALLLDPRNFETYNNMGISLSEYAIYMGGDSAGFYFHESIKCFNSSISFERDNPQAYNNWATALSHLANQTQGDLARVYYKESFGKYDTATTLNPNYALAFAGWADALSNYAMEQNTVASATEYFDLSFARYRKAVAIDSRYYKALHHWGCALSDYALKLNSKSGEIYFNESFEKFKQSVEINPSYYQTYLSWGDALGNLGRLFSDAASIKYFKEAFGKYDTATIKNPGYYQAYHNWANAYKDLALLSDSSNRDMYFHFAFDKYAQSIVVNPKYCNCYNSWGAALSDYATSLNRENAMKYLNESIEKYNMSIKCDANQYMAYFNKGNALNDYALLSDISDRAKYFIESFDNYVIALKNNPYNYDIYRCAAISIFNYYRVFALFIEIGNLEDHFKLLIDDVNERQDYSTCCIELANLVKFTTILNPKLVSYSTDLYELARSIQLSSGK